MKYCSIMKTTVNIFLGVIVLSSFGVKWLCTGFTMLPLNPGVSLALSRSDKTTCKAARREFLSHIGLIPVVLLPNIAALAEEDESLLSSMFNPDGSPKEGVEVEAKERVVSFKWDVSDQLVLNVDGTNIGDSKSGSGVTLSYKLPGKWADGTGTDELYFDRTEGTNAKPCKRITVFQASGVSDISRLEKASLIGVAKSLGTPEILKRLETADIISGRLAKRDGQTYYEFDMAAAPETCGKSAENLGLGFCPYDNIFLLSATIVNDRLYAIVVECEDTRLWKLASSELKRTRSSFSVQA